MRDSTSALGRHVGSRGVATSGKRTWRSSGHPNLIGMDMAILVGKPAREGHGPRARAGMLFAVLHVAVATSEPQRAGSSFWRTPIVVVPTIWIGEGNIPTSKTMDSEPWVMKLAATPQPAQVTSHFGNHLQVAPGRFSVFFYQRVDPAQPHFCGDYALEVGAYLCFLDDWYDDLPDVTVFLHQMPSVHDLLMAEWVALLRTDLTFTTLSPQYIVGRGTEAWRHQNISAWVEQCYRDVLKLAGVHHPRRERVAMSGCAPRPAYLAAIAIAGHHARRARRWRDCRAAPQVLLHRVCSEPQHGPSARALGVHGDAPSDRPTRLDLPRGPSRRAGPLPRDGRGQALLLP